MPQPVLNVLRGTSLVLLFCRYFNRVDVDVLAAFPFGESHCAVDERVQCVVTAHSYVNARMVHCAALALDDIAGFCILTTEQFDAQSFAF